jgi:hypothetical protein
MKPDPSITVSYIQKVVYKQLCYSTILLFLYLNIVKIASHQSNQSRQSNQKNKSIDALNRRSKIENPKYSRSKRSVSKTYVQSMNKLAQSNQSNDIYYPGISLAIIKSQKSEPMGRKTNIELRKLSLPNIQHSKDKHLGNHSSYSNNANPRVGSKKSDKNLKHIQSKEIGQSFISFNVNNSSVKNNTNVIPPA